ncbi:hypothetical protein EJ110_NYTH47891 [Nymphaea thermarum]|nr:hypothetical protein EJ110_NYTH47891 [Nymphaea thermarum]
MDAYFQKVRVIAHQLAIASKPIDEDDLVLYILRGLPVEYLAFKISLETRKEPVSLNELYSLLLMQEANQKNHKDEFLPTVNNVYKGHNERPHTYRGGRGRSAAAIAQLMDLGSLNLTQRAQGSKALVALCYFVSHAQLS